MEQQSEHNVQTAAVSVGSALRTARESAGLSLGEVADRLKLSMRQLEAIENDNFDALPGATFVRGFVRNYARFLEIDPAPLMTALDGHFPSAVKEVANLSREERESEPEAPSESSGGSGKAMVGLLVGAVAVSVAFWVYSGRENHESTQESQALLAASEAMASQSMAETSAPVASSMPVTTEASVPVVASAPVAKVAPLAASAPKAAVASAPKAVASAPVVHTEASAPQGSQGKVVVNASEEAWVSITDASGKKLLYSTLQPGATREISGQAPFRVVLGNAAKVTINYNGQAVDFSDKIRNTTAKIELK